MRDFLVESNNRSKLRIFFFANPIFLRFSGVYANFPAEKINFPRQGEKFPRQENAYTFRGNFCPEGSCLTAWRRS